MKNQPSVNVEPKLDPQLKAFSAALVSAMSWDDGDICPTWPWPRPWPWPEPGPGPVFDPDPVPWRIFRSGPVFDPLPVPWRGGTRRRVLDFAINEPAAWTSKLAIVALNPQPLPPGQIGALLGSTVLSHLLGSDRSGNVADTGFDIGQLAEFEEFCGTMSRWELLRNLFKKLLRKRWPIPDPEPEPHWNNKLSGLDLISLGAVLVQGSSLMSARSAEAVAKTGERLLRSGLSKS